MAYLIIQWYIASFIGKHRSCLIVHASKHNGSEHRVGLMSEYKCNGCVLLEATLEGLLVYKDEGRNLARE